MESYETEAIARDLASFKSSIERADWIFDLFAWGFDHLSKYFQPNLDIRQHEWEGQSEYLASERMGERVAFADGAIPSEVGHFLRVPNDAHALAETPFLIRLFVLLQTIDKAAAEFNYFMPGQDLGLWRQVRTHLSVNKQLNRYATGRVVLMPPRYAPGPAHGWSRKALEAHQVEHIPERGLHLYRWFSNLCRAPQCDDCLIIPRLIPAGSELDSDCWDVLRVAVIPLLLHMEVATDSAHLRPGPPRILRTSIEPSKFSIELPTDSAEILRSEICDAAEAALRFVAAQGIQIVIFPELAVPDFVLERIKQTLHSLRKYGSTQPQLVVAGTFIRPRTGAEARNYNVAVVLNGGGDELYRQSKLHPYEMHPHEQTRYGLAQLFGGKRTLEDIACTPREIVFCDSRQSGVRLAILICEDFCHTQPGLTAIRGMRPNLIVAPVMAGALEEGRSFADVATNLASDPQAVVIVGNSAALPLAEWRYRLAEGETLRYAQPPVGVVSIPLQHLSSHRPTTVLHTPVTLGKYVQVFYFECPTS